MQKYTNVFKISLINNSKKIFTDIEKNIIFLKRDEVLKLYNFNDFNYSNENHLKYLNKGTLHYMKSITPKIPQNCEEGRT